MYRLTKPQESVYNMEKFSKGSIAVICGSILVKGNQKISKLEYAIHELYRLNDALRIQIIETQDGTMQKAAPFTAQKIEILHFAGKTDLEAYADQYAKEPLELYGSLCEIKIVLLPDSYGILIKLHHMAGDAWTLSLIGSQFCAILDGRMPEAYSYTDYIISEEKYMQSARYAKDRAFFLEQFKSCDEPVYLSEKRSLGTEACRKTFMIDKAETECLSAYAKKQNTSVFALFMTAFAVYMSRIKMNADRFYIGTAILNRAGIKEKNTMGMFINTLPLLVKLNNDASFSENLALVNGEIFSVIRHQKYNYADMLSDIRREYHFGEKLYDVILSYQNAVITGGKEPFESSWYHNGAQTESLQIHIEDRDREGILRLHLDYQVEKFSDKEIEQLYKHLHHLLLDAVANDGKRPYELEMLSPSEKKVLLKEFNNTAIDYPRTMCVHQIFEAQAVRTPQKTAVIACDRTLTYKELNEQADRAARGLAVRGIETGDIVAFALPRKSSLIAVILGILKAGGVYMPIDLDYPQERVDYMLADSGAKLFITDENIEELLECDNGKPVAAQISGNSLCYCIYTSGTTGMPKGTLVTHRNVVNHCLANKYNRCYQKVVECCKSLLSVGTITFDIFSTEMLTSLLNGLCLVLAADEDIRTPAKLGKLAVRNSVDAMYCTPAKLLTYLGQNEFAMAMKHIKVVMVAGEAFQKQQYQELTHYTQAAIYNGYGPTETTMGVSFGEVGAGEITIGKPIANTQIYIVDSYLQPVPIGIVGELCIAGEGVGAGYLNRPELTKEKFLENPFGNGKLYRTGDLAYWREDGNLIYVGRNDFQVKVHGLRMELGEIENAIAGVKGITQAVVVVRQDMENRQQICCFYTGERTDSREIRMQLGKRLPKYMLPHSFTHLDELPLTASGKVDRRGLPKIALSDQTDLAEYIAPRTEEEQALVTSLQTLFGIDKVSVLDNFFDLGGDSLRAIELTAYLEKAGYHMDVRTIFACDTLEELAKTLKAAEPVEETGEFSGDVPATAAQMRVYTAQGMQGDSTVYNVPYVFRTKALDADRLEQAVKALIRRHDILRTHFENRNGTIVQVLDEQVEFKLERLTSADSSAFIRSFDLTKAPLLRVGCYENTVMIDMHHIITDGTSMSIFVRELNEVYMGRKLNETPVSYRQFAMQDRELRESEAYWLSVYQEEPPVLELNTDHKRKQKRTYQGSMIYDSIDAAFHQQILAKCRSWDVTPYVFYMGAFYILLSKFSGNEDIAVGMPIGGRQSRYLHTLGMFVNTAALRNFPVGTKKVKEFLDEVKDTSLKAMEHQDYSYGELVKKLNVNTPERNPLFDVMFAYQSESMTDVVFGDQRAELLPVPIATSKYDFTFYLMPGKKEVTIAAEYATDLYEESTLRRFLDGYRLVLEQMLDADCLLKDISVITGQEEDILRLTFNHTAVEYPYEKSVHGLFEEQVQKAPDRTAVIACDKVMTYTELNKQANQIAHGLMKQGVTAGDIVAFILPRKSILFVAMLGILKAGAAYMPIDPDYPQERISYMLEDSKAKFCITEESVSLLLENSRTENPNVNVTGERICYCIYTSGSTGRPKGTLLTHRNVLNYVHNNNNNVVHKIIQNEYKTILSVTTVGFDIFVTESLLPLTNGLEILFANEEQAAIQSELNALIKRFGADVMQTTPTKMRSLIKDSAACEYLRTLKTIILGGEALDSSLIDELRQLSSARIFNIYGPTETTVWSTNWEVDSGQDIAIGKPIANTQIYILDKYMALAPIGTTGELCIAGDGVGAGYLNRPELTAERFIDNPFGKGKLYRTGDLAYWRKDGNLIYVGRNDFQVKIRGLRIELGEIESAICSVDGVSQAVVAVQKDKDERQIICAFYTETEPVALGEIRKKIQEKLPRYMMPHTFTLLSEMPLTSSGKINRKGLPQVELKEVESNRQYIKPEGEVEKRLAAIMEQVLDYTPVGRYDDFFELGGDSLRAIEFVSMAHYEGIYFALQNVFDYPTIQQLAVCIEKGNKPDISFGDLDYTAIDKILKKNRMEYVGEQQAAEVGNILLTGATGYLGIHILADFLEHDKGTAYCIVRGESEEDSRKRFADLCGYYFGGRYKDSPRVKILCADLQEEHFGLSEQAYTQLLSKVDMVIHGAASVKHYGSYKYFYETNVESVKRLIKFCFEADAKLVHVSTLSVSGNSFADHFDGYVNEEETDFYESSLYVGQSLENVYARSKFEAEREVLEAMDRGLRANIMRMGNLTNRLRDGWFQKNYETNAFLKRVKAILKMGIFPDYLMELYLEFTPVDEAANALMTIVRHFSIEQTVFHLNSPKVVYMEQMRIYFEKLGYPLSIVSGKDFTDALKKTAQQRGMEFVFETFINDLDSNDQIIYDSKIRMKNDFTVQYLRRLGFEWTDIGLNYLKKYMAFFEKIGYLEGKDHA